MADTTSIAAGHARAAPEPTRRERIHRFSVLERVLHWAIAATGIICILTGLGWYAQSFQWVLPLFGGGATARWIHGIAGILMTAAAIVLFGVMWARHLFRMTRDDWAWLKVSGGYLRRHTKPAGAPPRAPAGVEQDVPPAGFFNGGQKLWGMLALALAIVFLISGLAIWSPELWRDFLGLQPLSPGLMRLSYVIHDLAFIIFAPMVTFHIYLSTVLNPGTLEAMTRGDVSRGWAMHHHPLWHRETVEDSEAGAD